MDIATGSQKRLTSKGKYYTPDISPSGNKIIAVRITDSLQTELQLLDSRTGAVLKKIKAGTSDIYFLNPRFVDENRIVVGIRNLKTEMSLNLIDIDHPENSERIVPFSNNTISLPFVAGNTVYFVSNANANDDLYAVSLKDKNIYQLTQDKTGNYYPSVFNDSLVWSHFTAEGLQLRTAPLNRSAWSEVNKMTWPEQASLYPVALAKNTVRRTSPPFFRTALQPVNGPL